MRAGGLAILVDTNTGDWYVSYRDEVARCSSPESCERTALQLIEREDARAQAQRDEGEGDGGGGGGGGGGVSDG